MFACLTLPVADFAHPSWWGWTEFSFHGWTKWLIQFSSCLSSYCLFQFLLSFIKICDIVIIETLNLSNCCFELSQWYNFEETQSFQDAQLNLFFLKNWTLIDPQKSTQVWLNGFLLSTNLSLGIFDINGVTKVLLCLLQYKRFDRISDIGIRNLFLEIEKQCSFGNTHFFYECF